MFLHIISRVDSVVCPSRTVFYRCKLTYPFNCSLRIIFVCAYCRLCVGAVIIKPTELSVYVILEGSVVIYVMWSTLPHLYKTGLWNVNMWCVVTCIRVISDLPRDILAPGAHYYNALLRVSYCIIRPFRPNRTHQ